MVVESQDQLNFRFTVLTRRLLVAYYNYNIAPCRSILFPPENFPRSRRSASISHLPLSLSEHSIASKGRRHHLLSSAACPSLISTTASRLTPNGCVLGALQLRSSRVSRSTGVSTRRYRTSETQRAKYVWNFRASACVMRDPCAVARAALSASILSCTSHMCLPSPSRFVQGCDCDTTEPEQARIIPPTAMYSYTHSMDAWRYPVS